MKLITFLLVALLAIPASLALLAPEDMRFRSGGPQRYNEYFYDPRVQRQEFDTIIYLTPPEPPIFARGYPAYYQRGTARIKSVRNPYKPSGQVLISTKDLRPSYNDNTWYQGWLYDADSGAFLNLGVFEAIGGGVGEIDYWGFQYLDAYDYVVVTREPRDDTDPRPSDDQVLIGKITHQPYTAYLPTPMLGEKAQYGRTYNVG